MKRAVIFGEFDSDNVGDQLIGEGAKLVFERAGWMATTVPLEFDRELGAAPTAQVPTGRGSALQQVHRRLYSRHRIYAHIMDIFTLVPGAKAYRSKVKAVLVGADLAVIGGGQLLSDRTLRMILRIYWITSIAKHLGIDIAFIGVGASAPQSFISRLLIRKIARQMRSSSLLVRDIYSAEVLGGLFLSSDIRVIPDLAIPAIHRFSIRQKKTPDPLLVGLAPMSHAHRHERIERLSDAWWANVAISFLDLGFNVALFCSGTSDDYARCKRIQIGLQQLGISIPLYDRPMNTAEFISQLSSMRHILANRLHISIGFLSLERIPAAVSWDKKISAFYAQHEMSDRVVDEIASAPREVARLVISTRFTPDIRKIVEDIQSQVENTLERLSS
jgi:polysaccharide pyruvyl transferase WcaK-like protein